MSNKHMATVVVGDWPDLFENREAFEKAYGCGATLHAHGEPAEDLDIKAGMLVLSTNRDLQKSDAFAGRSFPFSVRVVTFKVAMEMVKINAELGGDAL